MDEPACRIRRRPRGLAHRGITRARERRPLLLGAAPVRDPSGTPTSTITKHGSHGAAEAIGNRDGSPPAGVARARSVERQAGASGATFNELGRRTPTTSRAQRRSSTFTSRIRSSVLRAKLEVAFGALPARHAWCRGEYVRANGGTTMCWSATANGAREAARRPLQTQRRSAVTDPATSRRSTGAGGSPPTAKSTPVRSMRTARVVCWGLNDVGQLGVDPATVMQRILRGDHHGNGGRHNHRNPGPCHGTR
jgi:hypothetical protein